MPPVITKHHSSLCTCCRIRFKWIESKSGKCYWCETGKPHHPPTVEAKQGKLGKIVSKAPSKQ